jgi:hypothetical protein
MSVQDCSQTVDHCPPATEARRSCAPQCVFHPSVYSVVAELKRLGTPILACGQTVFWDEPVKVVLREILDALAPEVQLWLGIHDADYFSRGAPSFSGAKGCVPLPHNDFSTRDLWAAAGEISVLFGGEVVPSHAELARSGVSLEKAARAAEQDKADFLDLITEAWGWRGLACLGVDHPVAGQMPLAQVGEPLRNLLDWGFDSSLRILGSEEAQQKAQQVKGLILGWLEECLELQGDASLSSFYKHLLPRFCSLLLGRSGENLCFFAASEFFQFNSDTVERARFRLLSFFLNPQTAAAAREAYDGAVRVSGVYELSRFGPGALPFDILAPGRGRGTLFVTPSSVTVGFEGGDVSLPLTQPVESLPRLASVLESALGKDISLVGKAIVLPLMFSSEFIMALHEEASVYIPITKKMFRLLREKGLALPIHPILRLRHHTWSSLSSADASFNLPPHLAAAFQTEHITAKDFAATWEEAVTRQEALLEHLRRLKTPEELLAFLCTRDPAWKTECEQWGNGHRTLHEIGEWVKCYRMEAESLTGAINKLSLEVAELERQKGALRKQESINNAPVEAASGQIPSGSPLSREELVVQIRACHAMIRQKKILLGRVLAALKKVENGEEAVEARKTIARIEAKAELAKANLARDALLVKGLVRANYRPTAWWFPLVDAENNWFKQIVRTTELYFEEFDTP